MHLHGHAAGAAWWRIRRRATRGTFTPGVGGATALFSVAMNDMDYRLRILTRARVAGQLLRPGMVLVVPSDRLKVAAHLCRCRTGRPDDARTALDVELYLRLGGK